METPLSGQERKQMQNFANLLPLHCFLFYRFRFNQASALFVFLFAFYFILLFILCIGRDYLFFYSHSMSESFHKDRSPQYGISW